MRTRLIIGLAVLFLIGANIGVFALRLQTTNAPARKLYAPDPVGDVMAYDMTDPAPTTYGTFTADKVHIDASSDPTQIDLALSVDNTQYWPIAAPTLDELRVVTTEGAEATYLGGGWQGDAMVAPRSSRSGEFHFAAPPAGGMLILEYRERSDSTPLHFVVGYANPR